MKHQKLTKFGHFHHKTVAMTRTLMGTRKSIASVDLSRNIGGRMIEIPQKKNPEDPLRIKDTRIVSTLHARITRQVVPTDGSKYGSFLILW